MPFKKYSFKVKFMPECGEAILKSQTLIYCSLKGCVKLLTKDLKVTQRCFV